MDIRKKLLALFVGQSICLFLASYNELFLSLYMPVILAIVLLPALIKFPDHIFIHILISIATAIPISIFLIRLIPEHFFVDNIFSFFHLSRLEVATILVSMLLVKLPYFSLNWLRGVAKNALFAASFLILLNQLSLEYIPDGFGFIIYIVTPLLLPIIYHIVVGNLKTFRILATAILSYIALVGLDYYFLNKAKGNSEFLEGTYPGFLIIDYLIPVSFLFTLLLGYSPLKSSFVWKKKDRIEIDMGESDVSVEVVTNDTVDVNSGVKETKNPNDYNRLNNSEISETDKEKGLPSPQR